MFWALLPSIGMTSLVAIALSLYRSFLFPSTTFRAIPTIGPSKPLLSYIGAIRLLFDSMAMMQEGYDKHRHGIFKIADFRSWMFVVSGPQFVEDIRKAPPDVLMFEAAIDEAIHTLGPDTRRSHFHIPIIQNQLTRQLNESFLEIKDEVETTFNELIVLRDSDWKGFSALETTLQVVGRTAHRLFVGLPLCRDPGYVALNIEFALGISKASTIIRLVPPVIRQYVGRPFANVTSTLKRSMNYLRPLVEERRKNIQRYGKHYHGKSEDLLSWFMDEVDGQTDEEKLKHVAFHILIVDFGAVYTTAMSFTQALYHLAAYPEYADSLREEIENTLTEEGCNKIAMNKMVKLDSFLKESQRLSGLGAASTYRRVLKPFTFSDGTCIPPGNTIAVAAHSTHLDDDVYPEAKKFKGFRFVDTENAQMVTPSLDYLPFGVGRHMCPGRFFTVIILKIMMVHVLTHYDVKLEKEGVRPGDSWFITDNLPNASARVMFRKRAV